jgi:transcription elongation factor SPT6
LIDQFCRGSDLRGDFWYDRQRRDPYYSEDKNFLRLEYEKARKRKEEEKKKAFKPRMIVHPQFQNVPVDEAIKVIIIS